MQNCQDLHNLFGVGKQKLRLTSSKFHYLLPIHEYLDDGIEAIEVIEATDPF